MRTRVPQTTLGQHTLRRKKVSSEDKGKPCPAHSRIDATVRVYYSPSLLLASILQRGILFRYEIHTKQGHVGCK